MSEEIVVGDIILEQKLCIHTSKPKLIQTGHATPDAMYTVRKRLIFSTPDR